MEIVRVLLDFVQPIIVALDPSSDVGASNKTHEVGVLLVGVFGYGGVAIHDYELFECGKEVKGLAMISIEVFGRFFFQSEASVSIPVFTTLSTRVAIRV